MPSSFSWVMMKNVLEQKSKSPGPPCTFEFVNHDNHNFLSPCCFFVLGLFSSPGKDQSHPESRPRASPSSSVTQLSVILRTPPSHMSAPLFHLFIPLSVIFLRIVLEVCLLLAGCPPGAWLCNLLLMRPASWGCKDAGGRKPLGFLGLIIRTNIRVPS